MSGYSNSSYSIGGAKLALDDPSALPLIGHTYIDADGRRFRVDELDVADRLGRQVRGYTFPSEWLPREDGEPYVARLLHEGNVEIGIPYATDLKTWAWIWRDKAPSWKGRV